MGLHPVAKAQITLDCHVLRLRVLLLINNHYVGLHTFAHQSHNGFPTTLVNPTQSSGSQRWTLWELADFLAGIGSKPWFFTSRAWSLPTTVSTEQSKSLGSTIPILNSHVLQQPQYTNGLNSHFKENLSNTKGRETALWSFETHSLYSSFLCQGC